MKYKFLFLALFSIFLFTFVSADSQSLMIRYIVPDNINPTFDNLRNFTETINNPFDKSITASDNVGISCYSLNDTTSFNVDCSGNIVNVTNLDSVTIYWLNITVNDTSGNENSGEFYINITSGTTGGTAYTCRYKLFGYYNDELNYYKEINCI